MKTFYTLLLATIVLYLPVYSSAQEKGHVSRVKIHTSIGGLKKIRHGGIELDHGVYDKAAGTYINEVDYKDVAKIQALGFKVDILIHDVFAYTDSLNKVEDPYKYEKQPVTKRGNAKNLRLNFTSSTQSQTSYITTPSTFSFGSRGGFYDSAELISQIDNMVSSYPQLVKKDTFGYTVQNRPMIVIKISDNVGTDEPEAEVLYTGMHHSREGMSMMNLIYFMRYILENYSSNRDIKDLIDNRELFFIPVVNFDGFHYNTLSINWDAGRRMRRKNMTETTTTAAASNGSGGDGVDINRNYGTYWGTSYAKDGSTADAASSSTGSSDSYRGPAAFSEPETCNMRDFINGRQFKVALNYHCFGNWWIRPAGPDSVNYPATKVPEAHRSIYNSIAALFTKYNCYVYGTPEQTVYPVNGYSDDWLHADPSHSTIFSFSPEIGSSEAATVDGFWCPQSKIIPYSKEQVFPNIQAAYTAGSYAELQDNSDISITSLSGSFNYTVTRKGLTDGPIIVSILPLSNISSVGSAQTIASINSFGATHSGTISYTLPDNLASGSIIKYVWQLQTGGIIFNDTITKLYSPTVVFEDNMETSTDFTNKWVLSSNTSTWKYAAGEGFGGTASLTESANGNYAASSDQWITLKTALNLSSATKAYLSYMVRYKSENGQDRLRVEVSTDGGSTFTPISTEHTIVENRGSLGGMPALTGSTDGWVRDFADLSSHVGKSVFLRFRFLSNASTYAAYSTDGFNIDNLKVVKTNVIILPISLENITAKIAGANVLIQWKATIEADFAYYEVQRSSNGVAFETIATIQNGNTSTFTDNQPLHGSNFYRLKAVGKDGTVKLSKIVSVFFGPTVSVTAYPNPVSSLLTIEVVTAKSMQATIQLINSDGRVVLTKQVPLISGQNLYHMNLSYLPNQLYTLKVNDEDGKTLNHIKIIKNKL